MLEKQKPTAEEDIVFKKKPIERKVTSAQLRVAFQDSVAPEKDMRNSNTALRMIGQIKAEERQSANVTLNLTIKYAEIEHALAQTALRTGYKQALKDFSTRVASWQREQVPDRK